MEIFLSEQCESLTGSLGRGFGYYIHRRKNRFFSVRNTKGAVPPDGHWRFILTCAQLAQNKLHIADISVDGLELKLALWEAGFMYGLPAIDPDKTYNANEIIELNDKLK